MRPDSSATGMKESGETRLPSGRVQRASASAPTTAPLSRSTMGWKYTSSSRCSSARRSSCSSITKRCARSVSSGVKKR